MTSKELQDKYMTFLQERKDYSPTKAYERASELREMLDCRDCWVVFRYAGKDDEFA